MIALAGKGESPEEHFKKLDFSGFTFPSDGLSVGILRKKHSALFDNGFDDGEDAQPEFFFNAKYSEDIVGNMLFCERLIATFAYAGARGMEPPQCVLPVPTFKNDLSKLYVRYGIASGPHHAEQLIRDIERQGVELANQRQP